MNELRVAVVLILVAVTGCARAAQPVPRSPGGADLRSERESDPLRPLTQCDFIDDLRVLAVDRLPAEIRSRAVLTAEGQKSVSLADGYRVMLAYPGTEYFANLKIEMSEEPRYGDDKSAIIQHMDYLARQTSKEAGVQVPLEGSKYQTLELYGYTFRAIDFCFPNNPPALGCGPISIYVIFKDSTRTIITAYLLNQRPNRRRFATFDEYATLRDRFLDSYASCVSKVGDQKRR